MSTFGARQTVRISVPQIETFDVEIALGETLSTAAILGNNTLAGIILPSNYTTADLTFDVSTDGITYAKLYDTTGVVTITNADADRAISIEMDAFVGWQYIKIQTSVAQTAATTITLTAREY